jgi:hypothetical protein
VFWVDCVVVGFWFLFFGCLCFGVGEVGWLGGVLGVGWWIGLGFVGCWFCFVVVLRWYVR